jgi:hypothetical protein
MKMSSTLSTLRRLVKYETWFESIPKIKHPWITNRFSGLLE